MLLYTHTHMALGMTTVSGATEFGCVAVCCSVLQCVAVCCSVLQSFAAYTWDDNSTRGYRVRVCCSVLQCVVVCCSVYLG